MSPRSPASGPSSKPSPKVAGRPIESRAALGVVPAPLADLYQRAIDTRAAREVNAFLRAVMADIDSITDEPFLSKASDLVRNVASATARVGLYRALLTQACAVARARGASWTPAVDRLVLALAPGNTDVPPEAREAFTAARAWLRGVSDDRDLRHASHMSAFCLRGAVPLLVNAGAMTAQSFDLLHDTRFKADLWNNPTLTAVQRQVMVDRVAPVVKDKRAAGRAPGFAFLDALDSSGSESVARPTNRQLQQLATALTSRMAATRDARELIRNSHLDDLQRLLRVPDLPLSVLKHLLDFLPVGDERINHMNTIVPFLWQRAIGAPLVASWMRALAPRGVLFFGDALVNRPDILADREVRDLVRTDPKVSLDLLSAIARAAPAEEFTHVLGVLVKRAPTHAAALLEWAMASGVTLTQDQLLPLLQSRNQKLRMGAVMAASRLDPERVAATTTPVVGAR